MALGFNSVEADVRLILSIYPVMNSSFFSSVMAVFDKGQPLVYTFIPSFYSKYNIVKRFPHTCITLNNSLSNLLI